jgi:ATP-dependent exoDNAse (exonuclease V) beta subunit
VPDDLPEALAEVVGGLSTLRELHRQRNRRSIAETIGTLLATTRAHAGFANWPTGEQALANLMRLTDMARRAEQNGLISFRGFVDWLEDQAENGEAGDAPIMEEGVDGVRMMTVHKAKGLEFPVVLLADITCKDGREPSRWASPATKLCAMTLAGCVPIELQEHAAEEMQIDKEEAARTLYVAATRARDLLVVCAIGDQPFEGWLATLNPVIYPLESNSFDPETNQPPGCPKFGGDNAIARPRKALRPEGSVTPGLHKPQAGKHHVVWWDPASLELDKHSGGGSTLTELLKADEPGVRSGEGIRAHEEWQKQRATVRQVAGKAEWTVVTATAYAATLSDGGQSEKIGLAVPETLLNKAGMPTSLPEVTVESVEIDFDRPHGKRFGTLVHAVLSVAALDSGRAEVEEVARVQGRIFGATSVEIVAATETVSKALRHPLMRRAAAAASKGRCRREVPVAIKLQEGTIVEGIVDLAFHQEDKDTIWTVVDYKTDFEIKGRLEEYRNQVGLYALAISRATGQEVRAALLRL